MGEEKWEDKGLLLLSGHAAVALQRAEGSSLDGGMLLALPLSSLLPSSAVRWCDPRLFDQRRFSCNGSLSLTEIASPALMPSLQACLFRVVAAAPPRPFLFFLRTLPSLSHLIVRFRSKSELMSFDCDRRSTGIYGSNVTQSSRTPILWTSRHVRFKTQNNRLVFILRTMAWAAGRCSKSIQGGFLR